MGDLPIWALLIIAAITDLAWGKIHNVLTFPFMALGITLRSFAGFEGFFQSIIAVGLAFLILFPLWRLSVLAAGDVKLLMALGAFTHVRFVIETTLMAIVIGGLVALIVLWLRLGFWGMLKSLADHLKFRKEHASHHMPFGPAFLCAFFIVKLAEHHQWRIL